MYHQKCKTFRVNDDLRILNNLLHNKLSENLFTSYSKAACSVSVSSKRWFSFYTNFNIGDLMGLSPWSHIASWTGSTYIAEYNSIVSGGKITSPSNLGD